MKNIYRILLFSCVLFFTQTSCDKGFAELNENPLAPTEAQDGAIFNSIVESLQLGWNRQLFLHNEKLYDITELAVVTAETFGNAEAGAEDVWVNYYKALKNARELERRFAAYTEDAEIPNVAVTDTITRDSESRVSLVSTMYEPAQPGLEVKNKIYIYDAAGNISEILYQDDGGRTAFREVFTYEVTNVPVFNLPFYEIYFTQ